MSLRCTKFAYKIGSTKFVQNSPCSCIQKCGATTRYVQKNQGTKLVRAVRSVTVQYAHRVSRPSSRVQTREATSATPAGPSGERLRAAGPQECCSPSCGLRWREVSRPLCTVSISNPESMDCTVVMWNGNGQVVIKVFFLFSWSMEWVVSLQ